MYGQQSNCNSNFQTSWRGIMDLPQEYLEDTIKNKIVEVVAYIRNIEKDKIEARLVKEDKTFYPYKVFACKKQDPPEKKEAPREIPDCVDRYLRHKEVYNYPPTNNYPSYLYDYPMEEQSGDTPALAVEKFFTEAVKTISRQRKNKEKEFAKLEKDLASMDYLIGRIEKYAKEDAKNIEAKDEPKEDNSKRDTLPVIPVINDNNRDDSNNEVIVKEKLTFYNSDSKKDDLYSDQHLPVLYKEPSDKVALPELNPSNWEKILAY